MPGYVAVPIQILEVMFIVGLLGSVVVIVISAFEDVQIMFDTSDDETAHDL
jgi:hypothetical protein